MTVIHTLVQHFKKLCLTQSLPSLVNAYRVLLLLDLKNSSIDESPLDNISLRGDALNGLTALELAPESREVLELDEVPNGTEWSLNDSRLGDRSRCWDSGRHFEFFFGCWMAEFLCCFDLLIFVVV